ncbi:MAG: DUF4031 domain-containing protein [Propionibacteriaceae bacterium]|nr:DUF4031 domain-containing protein [Propionibacteriaceae bacterium]
MLARMILCDRPDWPAHGTVWGHVVSVQSLNELHAFADAVGLPRRGFDHDHYDYPAARFDDLVGAGAVVVASADLVRQLRASGLRVAHADRTPRRSTATADLRAAWPTLLPNADALGEELLARWAEPHRRYHDVRHLASCLRALDQLGCTDPIVRLAAWFHDAVYEGRPGADEDASADLAAERLAGLLPPGDVAEVARLVRLTATHDPDPDDTRGAALVDADLAILGSVPGRYHVYARDVRAEYSHLADDAYRAGRRAVLERLLDGPLYRTPAGHALWSDAAQRNLTDEWARLAPGSSDPLPW